MARGGLGYGARQHAPNEYFVVRGDGGVCGLPEAVLGYILLLEDYGGRAAAQRPKGGPGA